LVTAGTLRSEALPGKPGGRERKPEQNLDRWLPGGTLKPATQETRPETSRHLRAKSRAFAVINYRVVAMPMPEASSAGKIVRFGVFEVDLVSGELRKNGSRIRVQEQPFQVLTMLLERPGETVTREDLRSKLWPADTFVDFDHSLNTAVNKLREALGDAAANPRFVGTVARRGYRFIAPVEEKGEIRWRRNRRGFAWKARRGGASLRHRAAPELAVPVPRRGLTRGLFLLIQVMYLIFYLEALFIGRRRTGLRTRFCLDGVRWRS